jgi:ABC-type oligopeptide transport system substrate-binding subunit
MRCCLLRTLLSYQGAPTSQGGATLRPDLAASMPTVSDDGLTWTFRIRQGLQYAPPGFRWQNEDVSREANGGRFEDILT